MTKHIFIVNPAAGKGKGYAAMLDGIRDACEVSRVDYELHRTEGKSEATAFVRARIAEKPSGDTYRFYACGGDGTLCEVVGGAIDESRGAPIPGVQVGCIPIGTGNDFVRNFTHTEFFRDVTKQLLADPMTIDCFALADDRRAIELYGVNMANIGFDCDVVVEAARLKKKPFFPKKLAYLGGIALTLRKNLGPTLTVVRPDGSTLDGDFELVAVANGGFCGGGFFSAPRSKLDDGLLDLSFIGKVTRSEFVRMVGSYKKGTHLDTPLGRKYITYIQEKSVIFRFSKPTNVCVDGEIFELDEASFRVVPSAVEFLLPVGVEFRKEVRD